MPIALVTGGSRGIGAATGLRLAADGWDIAISYREAASDAASVVERCHGLGRRAVAVRADVSDENDVSDLFAAVDDQLGIIGALVNNAGIVGVKARVDETTRARLERMFAINVFGAFACARAAVLRMSTLHGGRGGVIVNVSSAASRLGAPGEYVDYAASKGAIDSMTVGLAKEVAAEGIRVNAVRPGIIATDIHGSGGQPDRADRMRHLIPMLRAGEADEIAGVIAWLCGPDATYVTGSLVDASGGR